MGKIILVILAGLLVGWTEARKMVMDAYAGFDPRMAELAEPFFERGWIDAPVKPGKEDKAPEEASD